MSRFYPAADLILGAGLYRRDRRPWLEARRLGLGASETAAILGLNKYTTPLQIWVEKTTTEPATDTPISESAEWGSDIEAVVARKVATRHPELGKLAPSPGLLQSRRWPQLLATVDRFLMARNGEPWREPAILEIKTTSERNYRENWVDGPPLAVQVQVQQQLAVTGLTTAYVAVLVGGQKMPAPYRIDRWDDTRMDALGARTAEWWARHVIDGVQPDAAALDNDFLADLYPQDIGDVLTATQDLEQIVFELTLIKEKQRDLDLQQAQHEAAIKQAMGETAQLENRNGLLLATWRTNTTSRFDTAGFRKDHADLAAQYTKTGSQRRFLIKTKGENLE